MADRHDSNILYCWIGDADLGRPNQGPVWRAVNRLNGAEVHLLDDGRGDANRQRNIQRYATWLAHQESNLEGFEPRPGDEPPRRLVVRPHSVSPVAQGLSDVQGLYQAVRTVVSVSASDSRKRYFLMRSDNRAAMETPWMLLAKEFMATVLEFTVNQEIREVPEDILADADWLTSTGPAGLDEKNERRTSTERPGLIAWIGKSDLAGRGVYRDTSASSGVRGSIFNALCQSDFRAVVLMDNLDLPDYSETSFADYEDHLIGQFPGIQVIRHLIPSESRNAGTFPEMYALNRRVCDGVRKENPKTPVIALVPSDSVPVFASWVRLAISDPHLHLWEIYRTSQGEEIVEPILWPNWGNRPRPIVWVFHERHAPLPGSAGHHNLSGMLDHLKKYFEIVPWDSKDLDGCWETLRAQRSRLAGFLIGMQWGTGSGFLEAGLDLLTPLRQRFPEIPCFMLDDEPTESRQQRAIARGASWCFEGRTHLPIRRLLLRFQQVAKLWYGGFEHLPLPEFNGANYPIIWDTLNTRLNQQLH
ncbi:MAG: hypothetical protein WCP34_16820, partial [Pseudomonadota bacterium]